MALTLENAGALVPGVKPKEDLVNTKMVTIRALRSFFNHESTIVEKGSIVTLPKILADQVIAANKAIIVETTIPAAEKEIKTEYKVEGKSEDKPKEETKASKKAAAY